MKTDAGNSADPFKKRAGSDGYDPPDARVETGAEAFEIRRWREADANIICFTCCTYIDGQDLR